MDSSLTRPGYISISTRDLQRELSIRQGVTTHIVPPHSEAHIRLPDGSEIIARGPCTVTVNND
jgi:hypothetical protein